MLIDRRQCLMLLLAGCGRRKLGAQKAGVAQMQMTLTLDRTVFWTAQEPIFQIALRNTSQQPLEVPSLSAVINRQPAYTLRGPSFPQGLTRGMRNLAPDMPPVLETIGPGQVLSARIGIQGMFGVLKPGDYTLSASMTLPEWQAKSETLSFSVRAARTLQTGLSVDDGTQDSYPLRVAVLAEDQEGLVLGMALFAEAGTHKNLVEFRTNFPIGRLPGKNGRLLGVASNRISVMAPQVRACAATDSAMNVWNPGTVKLDTLPLPANARVVRPALAGGDDVVSVFVFDPAARACGVLRFPLNAAPAPAWRQQLDAAVVAGRAAIGPDNTVCALLLAESGTGTEAILVEPTRLRRVLLPGLKPYADSEPALWRSSTGQVQSAMALRTADPRAPRLVTVDWPEGGGAGVVGGSAIAIPEPARAFAVGYTVVRGPRNLGWCAMLEGGALKTAGWGAPADWLTSRVSMPPELLILEDQLLLTGITTEGRAELIKIA